MYAITVQWNVVNYLAPTWERIHRGSREVALVKGSIGG